MNNITFYVTITYPSSLLARMSYHPINKTCLRTNHSIPNIETVKLKHHTQAKASYPYSGWEVPDVEIDILTLVTWEAAKLTVFPNVS